MRKIKQLLILLMTLSLLLGVFGCSSETPVGTASSDHPLILQLPKRLLSLPYLCSIPKLHKHCETQRIWILR